MLIIPDLFTPWIEGREKAIERNWSDLSNYNSVQSGQLKNFFDVATMSPRINKEFETTDALALKNIFDAGTLQNRFTRDDITTMLKMYEGNEGHMNDQLRQALFGGRLAQNDAWTGQQRQYAPELAARDMQAQLAQAEAARAQALAGGDAAAAGRTAPGIGGMAPGQVLPEKPLPGQPQTPAGGTTPPASGGQSPAPAQTPQGMKTPAMLMQEEEKAKRDAALAALAQRGIQPGQVQQWKIPGLVNNNAWYQAPNYRIPSSAGNPIPEGLLGVPAYGYDPNRFAIFGNDYQYVPDLNDPTGGTVMPPPQPIINNPTQEYQSVPVNELQQFGVTAESLQGMQPGTMNVYEGKRASVIVVRTPEGHYFVMPKTHTSNAVSGMYPVDVPAPGGQQ